MSLEQVAAVRAGLLAQRAAGPVPLAARRAGFEARMGSLPLPDDAAFTPCDFAEGLWVERPGADSDTTILWLHGGAFVLGSPNSWRDFGARLAGAAAQRVLLLDYPLAPEYPFPAALEASVAALDTLMERYRFVAVGGDSAGGNLAAAAVQSRIARGFPCPHACVLVSPYLDLTHSGASVAERGPRDPFVDTATMPQTATTYAGAADPADPRVSPLFGPIEGFPPTLVQVGSEEALFSDAARFAARLPHATFQEWAGMTHVWPLFAGQIDEGAWAIAQMGAFLRLAAERAYGS